MNLLKKSTNNLCRTHRRWTTLAALMLLAACAPSLKDGSGGGGVQIRFTINKDKLRGSALSASGGGTVTLPNDYCYAIHVTGPGIDAVSEADMTCGPAHGLGRMSPRAYNVGDTAEIDVKVGSDRLFELIGFASPLGTVNGRAVCGDSLRAEYRDSANPREKGIRIFVNNVEVGSHPILFAAGLSKIDVGLNNVTLEALPKVDSTLTAQLVFGVPFLRMDVPGAPQVCRPADNVLNPNQLFSNTGMSVPAPVTSGTGSGRKLQMITATPEIFVRATARGNVSAVPNANNTAELATGAGEVLQHRDVLRRPAGW